MCRTGPLDPRLATDARTNGWPPPLELRLSVGRLALPDMNGYDVPRTLKGDAATHDIPVILKTAVYLDEGHREVALDAGAAAYFAEPFDMQALVADRASESLAPDGRASCRLWKIAAHSQYDLKVPSAPGLVDPTCPSCRPGSASAS